MADVLLPIVPFTVPTTVTLVADVAPKSEGYNVAAATYNISDLDAPTRQALIDDFALAVLAL